MLGIDDSEFDVVVIGSGAGGLVAAIMAHDKGSKTVILEKSNKLGGTTSISAGVVWMPNNRHSRGANVQDSREDALTYLRRVTMDLEDADLLNTFLDEGPKMIDYVEAHTPVRFAVSMFPDYHPEFEGGRHGRSLDQEPFDGKLLPTDIFQRIRRSPYFPPITMRERDEWKSVLNFDFELMSKRIEENVFTMGSALVAGLLKACLDRGIHILPETHATSLTSSEGSVHNVRAKLRDGETTIRANKAVILASGGFDWNDQMKKDFLSIPSVAAVGVPSNEGEGITMGIELGAQLGNMSEAWWTPVIKVPGEELDGKPIARPFNSERALPGSIIVNRAGKRFVNEAHNYNDVGKTLQTFDPVSFEYTNIPAFIIFDDQYRRRYNFLTVMPGDPMPQWVSRRSSLSELALELGINGEMLNDTVSNFNKKALAGTDSDFHRGESAYDRAYGDLGVSPNPCLGPLTTPPYYGVEVSPGTLGTKGGLKINSSSQVIDVRGKLITGLYATGNVTASPMGRGYPGAGATLGQSMVFGYLAGIDTSIGKN
ncbi:MAG: FAD-binding protein [Nitrososphaerales archaeon]